MSSDVVFRDFIRTRYALDLQVYMTNEQLQTANIERNNRALFEACRDGAKEICEVLISFGSNVNSAVVHKQTLLFIACENAHPECVDLLLAHEVDVNVGDLDDSQTPLMATAHERNTPIGFDQFIDKRCQCMRLLMAAGAAIDQTDKDLWTALMHATWNFRLTEILAEAGANVNILNINWVSGIHIACGRNHSDVVDLLLRLGANITHVTFLIQPLFGCFSTIMLILTS